MTLFRGPRLVGNLARQKILICAAFILVFGGYARNIVLSLQTGYVLRGGHLQIQRKDYFLYGTGNPAAYGIADYQHVIDVVSHDPVLAPMLTVVTPTISLGGIAGKQPDVADVMGFDLRQDLGHAVDIGLAADEARIWKGAALRDQMFAAAEADFEPDLIGRRVEQPGKIGWAGLADVERQPRQQLLDQLNLMDAQLVALAPSEERTVGDSGDAIAGRRIAISGIAAGDAHRSV